MQVMRPTVRGSGFVSCAAHPHASVDKQPSFRACPDLVAQAAAPMQAPRERAATGAAHHGRAPAAHGAPRAGAARGARRPVAARGTPSNFGQLADIDLEDAGPDELRALVEALQQQVLALVYLRDSLAHSLLLEVGLEYGHVYLELRCIWDCS
jgi:hypothetical protein